MIARPPKRPRRPNERALVRSISIRDQSIVKQRGGITAIILAGSRPGADQLAHVYRSPIKALIPVAGKAMVAHVTSTLATHDRIERIIVLAQQTELLAHHEDTGWMARDERIAFVASGAGISSSLLDIMEKGKARYPLLVTTADNVLLDHSMIDSFLDGVDDADLAVAMVERRVLLSRYPQSRRTWLKFRQGCWSGANLFWLANDNVKPLLNLWRGVEQDRKKGMKIVAAFGPLLLAGALLRRLQIQRGVLLAGRRFCWKAHNIPMHQPGEFIDGHNPEDKAQVESKMATSPHERTG